MNEPPPTNPQSDPPPEPPPDSPQPDPSDTVDPPDKPDPLASEIVLKSSERGLAIAAFVNGALANIDDKAIRNVVGGGIGMASIVLVLSLALAILAFVTSLFVQVCSQLGPALESLGQGLTAVAIGIAQFLAAVVGLFILIGIIIAFVAKDS